jgi:hypothetical protein
MAIAAWPARAGSIWEGAGPWGPYGFGHQPELGPLPAPTTPSAWDRLADPVPPPPGGWSDTNPPPRVDTLSWTSFAGDGIPAWKSNCPLVYSPDQKPAVAPPSGADIGPDDMNALAAQWKAAHPGAAFRTDSQVGEACSGYNHNYLRTTAAFVKMPDAEKSSVFRWLAESGPMGGGSSTPLSSDPSPGPGNMVTSLPECTSLTKLARFPDWLLSGLSNPTTGLFHSLAQLAPSSFNCWNGPILAGFTSAMAWAWAGKRLYTDANGGRITNRFVSIASEAPGAQEFVSSPLGKLVNAVVPSIFPAGTPQSVEGLVFRGKSIVDGRDAIVLDWRGAPLSKAFPANIEIPHVMGMLVYDECRAIQTGVYACTANADLVGGEQRMFWQIGWMPWVVKGPPSIPEYVAAIR